MATATLKKHRKLPTTPSDRVVFVLQRGPETGMTIWEIVDKLVGDHHIHTVTYRQVKTILERMRRNDQAGVVGWKDETKRRKYPKYTYYRGYAGHERLVVGAPLRGIEANDVWSLVTYE